MNIQNIISISETLESLGFENLGGFLLKRICFKPEQFVVPQKIRKHNDQMVFNLFFERDSKLDVYNLTHYDAILQKEAVTNEIIITDINIMNLDNLMAEIDWKTAFDFTTKKQMLMDDKTNWENELKVESAIEFLLELEKSEEGEAASIELKLKYWTGIPYQELFGTISPLKNKSEISQRFYFSQGQPGISVDEAHRFLQNRWIEKQILSKRKQTGSEESSESENGSPASSGSGLLKKKRSAKAKGIKSNKPFLH